MKLSEVHVIDPWLVGEECKPIIVCDAEEAFILYFPERLPAVCLAGLPDSGVAYCLTKRETGT